MAWSSVMMSATFVDVFNNTIAMNLGSDTWYCALFNDSVSASADTASAAYGTAPWATNEVTGTNWPSGGIAMSNFAVSINSGVGITFDADDTTAANTTISSAAYGCLVYDSTVSNRALVAVYFGGSGYTTNNGTFGITWDSSGIAAIDLTP